VVQNFSKALKIGFISLIRAALIKAVEGSNVFVEYFSRIVARIKI